MHLSRKLLLVCTLASILGCAGIERGGSASDALASAPHDSLEPTASAVSRELEFGIESAVVRLTNHGTFIDFRFRVVDEMLARRVLDRDVPIRLIDRATGSKGLVIGSPKVGPLRNTGMPVEGRTYYVLFANPGLCLEPGSTIDIEIGDSKLEGLTLK